MGKDIDPVLELERQRSEAATKLDFLHSPPGNRPETLAGKREGQHSSRINDQWRICFEWRDEGIFNVEIVDYH